MIVSVCDEQRSVRLAKMDTIRMLEFGRVTLTLLVTEVKQIPHVFVGTRDVKSCLSFLTDSSDRGALRICDKVAHLSIDNSSRDALRLCPGCVVWT